MKNILILTVFLMSCIASAAELSCESRIISAEQATQLESLKIEKSENRISEKGTKYIDDLELAVYRDSNPDFTTLVIGQRKDSNSPYFNLARTQLLHLSPGQSLKLSATVSHKIYTISCSVK